MLPVAGPLEAPVPDRALFGAESYELIGIASGEPDGAASIRIDRGLASIAEAAVGIFLPVPRGLSTDGTTFAFQPVAGAHFHLFGVTSSAGRTAWGVAVFDGSTEVVRPDVVSLPGGELRYGLEAIEIPDLDPRDFSIDEVDGLVTRVAGDSVNFTN
jgi:hypothetical protein